MPVKVCSFRINSEDPEDDAVIRVYEQYLDQFHPGEEVGFDVRGFVRTLCQELLADPGYNMQGPERNDVTNEELLAEVRSLRKLITDGELRMIGNDAPIVQPDSDDYEDEYDEELLGYVISQVRR